jgi:methyl-accepting chemotaxis protein
VISMEEGTQKVDEGILLADKAGASLHEIVGISQKVTDMVTQIAAASEQQSSASEQISRNVEAISTVTSETAQGTHQIARAAEDLNRLTDELQALVARFKLHSTTNAPKLKRHGTGTYAGMINNPARHTGRIRRCKENSVPL